jgi:hypothetical protein
LALDVSKDEFQSALKQLLGPGGLGVKRYDRDPGTFVDALISMGVLSELATLANRPVSWKDLLIERLKSGRGSAIKGQARGRSLEDFVEGILSRVFDEGGYDLRCRFLGARGDSTEKADFAIPSRSDPRVLIEVKAYGATGSKQTDILGDIARIAEEKRHDTHLLLVTDGISWQARQSDLSKLVEMQNRGLITRIYTHQMATDLEDDLQQLKREHAI